MAKTDNHFDIIVVVSGVPRPQRINVHAPLQNLIRDALRDSGDAGRPAEEFELRTENGRLLDPSMDALDAGIKDGDTLFLAPRAGAGG